MNPIGTQPGTQQALWQALVANALLGSGRHSANAVVANDAIGALLAQLDSNQAEHHLLSSAAILAIARRAGQKAQPRLPSLSPASLRDLPVASNTANRILATLLAGTHTTLLPEWLSLAAQRGERAADEHLPTLLDLGATRPAIADPIRGVLGRRGEWLASLNPTWVFALNVEEHSQEVWETGAAESRLQALKSLRQRDANAARTLVSKSWASEPPNLRPKILAIFATNLSLNDEEFLESTLDDRRKEVREQAAELLARLPQSKLSERNAQRLRPLLKLTGLLRKSVDVTLPTECTAAMQRDGIQEKVPAHLDKLGQRAWWLRQMVAVTVPSLWLSLLNSNLQRLIDAATRSEWSDLLLDGWLDAATLHGDTEMLTALADHFSSNNPAKLARSMDGLPPSYFAQKILGKLSQRNIVLSNSEAEIALLTNHRHPWSIELTVAFVVALQRTLQQPYNYQIHGWLSYALPTMAQYAAPAIIERKLPEIKIEREDWAMTRKAVDEFFALLQFRYEMQRAFKQKG